MRELETRSRALLPQWIASQWNGYLKAVNFIEHIIGQKASHTMHYTEWKIRQFPNPTLKLLDLAVPAARWRCSATKKNFDGRRSRYFFPLFLFTAFVYYKRRRMKKTQAMLPALEAILGQRSAHSLETGPVMADPFISPWNWRGKTF
jgi:hypothetical protein